MQRLTPSQISKYVSKMKYLAPETECNGTPKPKFAKISKDISGCLIGCVDVCGLNRYWIVRSQEDIDKLVDCIMMGGGIGIEWRYLKTKNIEEKDINILNPTIVTMLKEALPKMEVSHVHLENDN